MQVIVNDIIHNRQTLAYNRNAGFTIGSAPHNSVILGNSRLVAPIHLTIDRDHEAWIITVHPAATAVAIDGVEVPAGASRALKPISEVTLTGYGLTFYQSSEFSEVITAQATDLNRIQRDIHQKVIERMELRRDEHRAVTASSAMIIRINNSIDEIIKSDYVNELGVRGTQRLTMLALALNSRRQRAQRHDTARAKTVSYILPDPTLEKIASEYDARVQAALPADSDGELIAGHDPRLMVITEKLVAEMPENVQFYIMSGYFKKVIGDLIFGFGPLQDILEMPGVSEIMVVSPTQVYVEQKGKVSQTASTFLGDAELLAVLERIVAPLGRRLDRSSPIVDARLPDGSRVNAIIPPLALKGPCVTIRRFPEESVTYQHLLNWGSLTSAAVELLRGLVRARKNIIVAGGTGSGKTTMLNVMSNFIDEYERLVTIEDSAELQLQHEHLVALETRPKNSEGKGEIDIRDLVKNALRMRPDRIIVGECRGGEAFDMLQAMNTGHNGSMTTVHANSPYDVIARLESMCLMAVAIPIQAIRQQIAQAVHYIVYLERLPTGQRMTTAIAEVSGIHPHTGEIMTRLIMKANFHEDDGLYHLAANGYIPVALPELVAKGFIDPRKVFG